MSQVKGKNERQTMAKSLFLILCSLTIYPPASFGDNDASPEVQSKIDKPSVEGKPAEKHSSAVLYGRIEQIVQGPGAQFPITLKAQTARMDTRKITTPQQKGEASFSGVVVKSFPQRFTGTWGGNLKIWSTQIDPICWQIDSDEANKMRSLFTTGQAGSVNFNFAQDNTGAIDLEPAQVVFMVPMKNTHMQEEMNGLLGSGQLGQAAGMTLPGMDSKQLAGMMKQVMSNMNVPVMIDFGAINRSDVEGISGNSVRAVVLKNSIRQLGPGILEQQIVTQETQRNNKTGKVRYEYAETVIRFTSQDANDLYVQAAAVNYTADRKFERKLILYGSVRKGQVMPDMTNPLGGLPNMRRGVHNYLNCRQDKTRSRDYFPKYHHINKLNSRINGWFGLSRFMDKKTWN